MAVEAEEAVGSEDAVKAVNKPIEELEARNTRGDSTYQTNTKSHEYTAKSNTIKTSKPWTKLVVYNGFTIS